MTLPKDRRYEDAADNIQTLYLIEHEEVFRSVFTYGQLAAKTLLLLNGAAALALLAFLGKLAGEGSLSLSAALVPALNYFAFGAACAGAVAACGYISQTGYINDMWREQGRGYTGWLIHVAVPAHWISVILAGAGLVLFVLGIVEAGNAIESAA